MKQEIKLTKREPTWNYILNDLALYSLMTKVIHSEVATYQDKFDLVYQIELLQKQNTELKDNWNKLKECIKNEIERTENLIEEDCNMIQINNIRKMLNNDRECWLFKMQEIEGGTNE